MSIAPLVARHNQRARGGFPLGEQVEALEQLTEKLLADYREKPSETRRRIDSRGRGVAFRLNRDKHRGAQSTLRIFSTPRGFGGSP